jgi:hypothetical protein
MTAAQDVATRLLLEIQRVAYGMDVVSRGPQLVSTSFSGGKLVATFSNASLLTHAGLFVGNNATCAALPTNNTAVMQFPRKATLSWTRVGTGPVPVDFRISGATLTIACDPGGGAVHVNADASSCFVFGGAAPHLPATPIELNCTRSSSNINNKNNNS